jgi:hypothetical protein
MGKIIFLILLLPLGLIAQTEDTQTESAGDSIKLIKKCIAGDCIDGKGTMQYQGGLYVGDWKDGVRAGVGKYTWKNGDVYTGYWDKDKRHGEGIYIWKDGSKYRGNYSYGVRSGYGIYFYTNGSIYEGTWQNNLKHGIANFYYKESVNIGGQYYHNEYVNGTGISQGTYKYKPENNL